MQLIQIADSHVPEKECWNMTIYSKYSKSYVYVRNNTVRADSEDKTYLYSIGLENSIKFFLYDPVSHKFICMSKEGRLIAKKVPRTDFCTFEDRVFAFGTSYIQYVQPHYKQAIKFSKRGRSLPRQFRHPNSHNDMSAFLSKKEFLEMDECDHLKRGFCCRMRSKRRFYAKLPKELRTLCRSILPSEKYCHRS
ncbi:PREDICTED: uncharacterized protein LOC108557403 isoform X2 [Nicrophorus vespilloides]|uniref:Uncharacterized protein LOC108557403 isoform X2 n=1 Tax=Nicrophorus vespilloides TaxID=110193 RepID=A0ABM1M489_NICVS|nr:PREDICTED: uncharacterized protein LOC108557403 isoform X2 [Nicrophorus vespilloides]